MKYTISGVALFGLASLCVSAVTFMLLGSGVSGATAETVETVGLSVDFDQSSHTELIKKAWGPDCPVVSRYDDCLQLNSRSEASTDFLTYTNGGDVTVSLDLKLTDITEYTNAWELCWLSVYWYDASQGSLGHSDIIITGEAADWHGEEKTFTSPPTGTTYYKVSLSNAGSEGTVWVDNVSIISSGVDETIDFESDDWISQLPNGWGTKVLVDHDTQTALHNYCLQIEKNSSADTDLFSYNSGGNISVSLDLKLTDIVPGDASYKKCWLKVNWYDSSQTGLGHSDIIITGDVADWHLVEKTFTSPPTGTTYYKVSLSNAGSEGTVWVDNVSIISSGVDEMIDFESDDWTDQLPGGWGTKIRVDEDGLDLCREIPAGAALTTRIQIPYQGGRIKVSLDLKLTDIAPNVDRYKACRINVSFMDSTGTNVIGHSDVVVTKEKAGWTTYEKTFEIARNARSFVLTMNNAGSNGTVWVDNVQVVVEKDGVNACTDSSFKDNLLYGGEWAAPTSGVDWNSTALFTTGAIRKVSDETAAGGNSSLYISGNATVISPTMAITFNDVLHAGAWCRSRSLSGVTDPGRVQLVYYNSSNQIIGHEDLCAVSGDTDWNYFSGEYHPPVAAASAEIWTRILAGGQGEAWFDEVTLVKLDDPAAYDPDGGTVSIDADNPPDTTIHSAVWENISQGYLDRVGGSAVQAQMQTLADDGVIKRFRGFDVLQDGRVLSSISNGVPVYDFARLDRFLDVIVKINGFIPLLTLGTTPNQIATVDMGDTNYKNPYPPRADSYDLLGLIIEDTVSHLVERYGANAVTNWAFDVWNEPSSASYFYGTQEEYLQMYDQVLDAFLSVENTYGISLQLGTMSAVSGFPWFKALFDHLEEHGKLQHVDFLSFHIYAGTKLAFSNFSAEIKRVKALRDSYPDLSGKPLFISEYNGNSMPGDIYRDTQVMASCAVKACRVALDTGVDRLWYFNGFTFYPSGLATANEHFNTSGGMMTISNIRKPVANAYKLLGKLSGGQRLPLVSSNEPVDGFAVLAENGSKLRILLTTFDDRELNTNRDMEISVTIDWADMPTSLSAEITRVDETHANAHTEWMGLGEPLIDETTSAEWDALRVAEELSTESFTNFNAAGDQITFTVTMQRNSIAYLEFK